LSSPAKLAIEKSLSSLRKYYNIPPDAWYSYLDQIKRGEHPFPFNENEMRCFFFSECLEIMRKGRFSKPYQISVENKEILEGRSADLALGWTDIGSFIAVELKRFPAVEEVKEDIEKLHQATEAKAICGFFLALCDATYDYRKNLDLRALDIEENGRHSWFAWKTIKPKHLDILIDALIVFLCPSGS